MKSFETVPKHYGKLRVLLQNLPYRVIEIGLHCGVDLAMALSVRHNEVNFTAKHFNVRDGWQETDHIIF